MNTNESRIKLLYITTLPLAQWWFLRGQNQFLSEKGFELHSITSKGKYLEELAKRDGMDVYTVDISRSIVPHKDFSACMEIFRLIKIIKPDIIHLSTPKAAFLGSVAAWLARVPVSVFLVRGLHTENTFGLRRNFFKLAEWLTAKCSTDSIFTSPSLLAFARKEGIVSPNQGEVLAHGMSNGIDTRRFSLTNVETEHDLDQLRSGLSIPKEAKVIGYVGRLANDKGISDLAKAWADIRTKYVDAHLLLVGPWFEELDPIPPAVKSSLELDPRVHFTGHVAETAPFYALMNVKVFPSHGTEGFPNAPMEAAAMGLPVVATAVVGSVDAVVDGVTGTLVERRNSKALALAIMKYLSDPELCKQHGTAGRQRVEKYFRQEIIWEALYNKYCELLRPIYQAEKVKP